MDDIENMSLEDLIKLRAKLEIEVGQLDSQQMAAKIQINAVYGAFAAMAFRYFDPNIAEAITQTGQLVIRMAEMAINQYLNNILKTDSKDYVVALDTDSVVGDTLVYVNGSPQTIASLFDDVSKSGKYVKFNPANNDFVVEPTIHTTTRSVSDGLKLNDQKIEYVMKHKVKKRFFEITCGGKSVIVTEDHSICVLRGGSLISCKPHQILPTDHFVVSHPQHK